MGLGGKRLEYNQLSENEINELAQQMPTLTYGQAKQMPPESFVPAHVAFDKKVSKDYSFLYKKFLCYFLTKNRFELKVLQSAYKLDNNKLLIIMVQRIFFQGVL